MRGFLIRDCRFLKVAMLLIGTVIAGSCGGGLMGQTPGRPDCNGPGSGGVVGCPDGRPCFNGDGQEGNNLVFNFTGTHFDFFNVRYKTVSGEEKQETSKDGKWVVYNVKPSASYTIKVQGCTSHTFGHSDCSQWVEMTLYTHPLHAAPCRTVF